MGKKKNKQKEPLSLETRERIASYLYSKEMKYLAKKVLNGEFNPDRSKWEKHILEHEKRKTKNHLAFEKRQKKLIIKLEKRHKKFLLECEQIRGQQKTNNEIENENNITEPSSGTNNNTLHELYEKSNIIKLKQSIMDQLKTIDFKKASENLNLHKNDIKKFINIKWKDINSIKRNFALSKDKSYPVEVLVSALRRIGIDKFQFNQSGFIPPEVGVDFIMKFGVNFHCSINGNGNLRIQRELKDLFPNQYQLLFNLATIVYYADLIIPITRNTFKSNLRGPLTGKTKKKHGYQKKKKYIPRLKNSSKTNNISETTVSSDEHSIFVDPFRRKLPAGQKPSFEKIVEADQFGINLQGIGYPEIQYTFVKGHIRGNSDEIPGYYYGYDYKSVKTFETILDLIGFNF